MFLDFELNSCLLSYKFRAIRIDSIDLMNNMKTVKFDLPYEKIYDIIIRECHIYTRFRTI